MNTEHTEPEQTASPDAQPERVDYARYESEYASRLELLNRMFRTGEQLELATELAPLLATINRSYDPLRPRGEAATPTLRQRLTAPFRKLLRRLVRSALSDELANVQAFNALQVQALNHLADTVRAFAVQQRDFNVNVAAFGQNIVPVIDGRVLHAYRTLDALICQTNDVLRETTEMHKHMLMSRMDVAFAVLDQRQEVFANRQELFDLHLDNVRKGMSELSDWLHNTAKTLADFREELDKSMQEYRHGLRLQHRKIEQLGAPAAAAAVSELQIAASEASTGATTRSASVPAAAEALDSYSYYLFEQDHRGSDEDIKHRFSDYLPYFTSGPVLDIGCGRGEFLELLQGRGLQASGIDLNGDMVATCRDKGLDVQQAEALGYLPTLAEGSLGGVFMAQVVEHLPPARLKDVFEQCCRVLKDDGVLLIETINPASLYALTHNFLKDLTHRWPLPPDTVKFLLSIIGFRRLELLYRSPVDPALLLPLLAPTEGDLPPQITPLLTNLNHTIGQLNDLLFGYCDYALIAWK